MTDYYVTFTIPVNITVKVEAENKDDARDATVNDAYLTSFGLDDKLIGTNIENATVEPNNDLCQFWKVQTQEEFEKE
jgi:hypothetical protein